MSGMPMGSKQPPRQQHYRVRSQDQLLAALQHEKHITRIHFPHPDAAPVCLRAVQAG